MKNHLASTHTHDTISSGWGLSQLPKAIVGLSGSYDLSSRMGDTQDQIDRFTDVAINYTNINNRNANDPGQKGGLCYFSYLAHRREPDPTHAFV